MGDFDASQKQLIDGTLVGSQAVLLNKGGAGSGSSYASVEDYEATTGLNVKGAGLDEKLSKLMVKPLTKSRIIFGLKCKLFTKIILSLEIV